MGKEIVDLFISKFIRDLEEAQIDSKRLPFRSTFTEIKEMVEKKKNSPKMTVDLLRNLNYILEDCQMISEKRPDTKKNNSFCLNHFKESLSRLKIESRLLEVRKALSSIPDCAAGSSSTANLSSIIDRRSDSLVNVSGIYGFDDQVKKLEKLLLQYGGSDKTKTIGIVGMGGAGKTTLAQLVFNSPNVQSVYFPRIWICLSRTYNEDPDAIRSTLVEYMMEQLGEDEDTLSFLIDGNGGCGLDQLLLGLRQRLQGKRYLIVLDDVWRVSEWYEGLAVPELDEPSQHTESGHRLTYGLPKSHGCGIIVTSRLEEVAKRMVGETNLYRLQPLKDTDIWSIFIQTAQNQGMEFDNSDLTSLKDEIVENCGGLPSAAQALGKKRFRATESEAANQIVRQFGEFGGP